MDSEAHETRIAFTSEQIRALESELTSDPQFQVTVKYSSPRSWYFFFLAIAKILITFVKLLKRTFLLRYDLMYPRLASNPLGS